MALQKNRRKVKLIILHCSDSDNPLHDNINTIREWHTLRGFTGPDGIKGSQDDIGYHWFIDKKGTLYKGRDEQYVGAHVKNHNRFSIGICFSGRTFKDFHTDQFITGRKLIIDLLKKYNLTKNDVILHRTLDPGKTCPNFTLAQFWNEGK